MDEVSTVNNEHDSNFHQTGQRVTFIAEEITVRFYPASYPLLQFA